PVMQEQVTLRTAKPVETIQRSLDDFWSVAAAPPVANADVDVPDPSLGPADSLRTHEYAAPADSAGSDEDMLEGDGGVTSDTHDANATTAAARADRNLRGPLVETGLVRSIPGSNMLEIVKVLDVRYVGFCDRRWIISRKRGRNLYDIISALKKTILESQSNDDLIAAVDFDNW
ncbi:hypothetical protein EW146_g7121, partial [Bondarzewia mesenterica]